MKDKILFENNYENLKNSCCHSCRSKDHFIKDCPFIHFTPNRDLLFKKLQYSQPNDRNILFKRKPTKIFSRLNCLKYKDNLKKIRSKFKLEKRGMFMKMRELITIKEIYDFDKDFSSNQNLEFKDDSYIESEKSDLNLSKSLILQSDPEIEPKNKTHNENEEMDSPIASFNRLDKSKKSTLNLTSKNKTTKSAFKLEEYELNVIEKINERRAIILKKERTGLDIIKLKSYDLFDFEFETISFNNHYYYRNHNFDNCIFKFKKYLKNKERRRNKDKRDEGMMSPLFQ